MHKDNFSEIVERLRENGYTDRHLAKLCGCTPQTIFNIRKGTTRAPKWYIVARLRNLDEALQ